MRSSNGLIPKGKLAGYERWRLDTFDAPAKADHIAQLPTVEELEQLRDNARNEGYAAGYHEGSAHAAAEAERLAALVQNLDVQLSEMDQAIADNLVALALEVARSVVGVTLAAHPAQVLDVVRKATDALPLFGQHAQLLLHPEDTALVRKQLGEQLHHAGWKLIESHTIERGGCRLESPATRIDATLSTRWQRVVASLGRDEPWQRPDNNGDSA